MKKSIYLLASLLLLASCDYIIQLKPSGKTIAKEITQNPIYTINNRSMYHIEFTHDLPKNTIYIKGDEAFVENLQIDFESGTINFSNKKGSNHFDSDLKIQINAPEIKSITLSGASDIVGTNYLFKNNLSLSITGTGNIDIEVQNEYSEVLLSGAGSLKIKGKTNKLSTNISGTGSVDAQQLVAEQGLINISGVGSAKINVSQQLNATVSGTGTLAYKDYPTLSIKKNISGVGTIHTY